MACFTECSIGANPRGRGAHFDPFAAAEARQDRLEQLHALLDGEFAPVSRHAHGVVRIEQGPHRRFKAALKAGSDAAPLDLVDATLDLPWSAPTEVVHPLGYDDPTFWRTRRWLESERSRKTLF